MKLSLEHILDRVNRLEDKRAGYKTIAAYWEKMWSLDPGFGRSLEEAVKAGQEQIVLPTPFNIVNLAQRLLASEPKIDVMPREVAVREAEEDAELCEKWLTAMWTRINLQQKRNVLGDAIWYALVRGRFAFEVKWVKDELPTRLQGRGFPIMIRTLDPMNVGVHQGPLYTEYAYHKYETSLLDVLQRWPKLRNVEGDSELGRLMREMEDNDGAGEDATVEMTDFWYQDKKGNIWNAVLAGDEFAKTPKKTDYPEIPIVVGRGDYAPNLGDEYDGLSILHPLKGLWEYQCRLASQMGTGLLWHFWPAILVSNEMGEVQEDILIGPGKTTPAPAGTKVDLIRIDPNVPLAQAVYGQVDAHVQQSGFPEVMYGKAPGDLQAGYGVSLLSDAAKGRIKNFLESLEMALSHVNGLVMAIIEEFGEDGVQIWGVNDRDDEKFVLKLSGDMIKGNYDNRVTLTPQIPQNVDRKQTLGLRLADQKYISAQTLRDKFLDIAMPSDETRRIAIEELFQSDELRPLRLRRAAVSYEPEKWKELLAGTPFMPPPPEGFEWAPDGTLRELPQQPPQQPQMQGPGAPPPGGPPPGMHPMPDGSMMPDEMMQQGPPGPGGPPMPGQGGPPPGGPGQAATLVGPTGGGMPPELDAGQFTPEDLQMLRQQDPQLFAELMNRSLPPEEELANLEG